MPILIVIAIFERHFRSHRHGSQPENTGQDDPSRSRRPSFFHAFTNVKSIRLVQSIFDVDLGSHDDISLFDGEQTPAKATFGPHAGPENRGLSPVKGRSRVESAPSPFAAEPLYPRRVSRVISQRMAPPPGRNDCAGINMQEEFEDIKASTCSISF